MLHKTMDFTAFFGGFLEGEFPDPHFEGASRGGGSGDTKNRGLAAPLAEALKPLYLQGLATLKAQNGPHTPISG